MKTSHLLTGLLILASSSAFAADEAVPAAEMGLTKTSVFDVPVPEPFTYTEAKPGKSDNLDRAYPGAPPQIPHRVSDALPLTANENLCLDCHDKPRRWGKEVKKGKPTPMPKSHYTDPRTGEFNKKTVSGARYFCNQCHTPQAEAAEVLVENDFADE